MNSPVNDVADNHVKSDRARCPANRVQWDHAVSTSASKDGSSMNLRCLFNKHSFGLPRLDETGASVMECLVCLHVRHTLVPLPPLHIRQIQN